MAIAAAANPIAILRIMMLTPFDLSTPAFPNQNSALPIELPAWRHSRSVSGFGIRAPKGSRVEMFAS